VGEELFELSRPAASELEELGDDRNVLRLVELDGLANLDEELLDLLGEGLALSAGVALADLQVGVVRAHDRLVVVGVGEVGVARPQADLEVVVLALEQSLLDLDHVALGRVPAQLVQVLRHEVQVFGDLS